jgi:hypothetical protein
MLGGGVVKKGAILGHHHVEQFNLRKDFENVGKFAAGDENRPPAGSLQSLERFSGFFVHHAMDCKRIVVIGRQCHKKHEVQLPSLHRSQLPSYVKVPDWHSLLEVMLSAFRLYCLYQSTLR